MLMMKIMTGIALCISALSFSAQAADIVGSWRTIDDQNGFTRSIVTVNKDSNNTYTGTIVKIFPLPDKPLVEICKKCPPPLTDKPFVGLNILQNLVDDPKKPNHFMNGTILDPLSGKTYRMKARLSADGRRLTIRGYVGVSLLGRSQTWMREQ
jgi:uncharacterized protein (DUF2147 family)